MHDQLVFTFLAIVAMHCSSEIRKHIIFYNISFNVAECNISTIWIKKQRRRTQVLLQKLQIQIFVLYYIKFLLIWEEEFFLKYHLFFLDMIINIMSGRYFMDILHAIHPLKWSCMTFRQLPCESMLKKHDI